MKYKTWTEAELNDLKFMVEELNLPYYDIAEILGRTRLSIEKKCPRVGIISNYNKKRNTEDYKLLLPKDIQVLEEYINDKFKILHKHISCGHTWKVRPSGIINGNGCPLCNTGFKIDKPASTYCIYFEELNLYKVGITNNIKIRMLGFGYKSEIIFIRDFENGHDAAFLEKEWLNNIKEYLVNTHRLKSGNTETFKLDRGDIILEWSDELKEQVKNDYAEANPTPENSTEIVKNIAEDIDMTVNGVRAVLVRAGVYIKKTPATGATSGETKTGSTRVNKADAIKSLKEIISNNSLDVEDDIIDKLTGKAAIYFKGLFEGLTTKES